jgi:hypothetical protein
MTDDYKVGFKQPPKHCQFKKGQSGNPKGRRRKASRSPDEVLEEVLSRPVQMKVGDTVVTVPAFEAILNSLAAKAMKGDVKAFESIMKLRAPTSAAQQGGGEASGITWTELHESLRPYIEHLLNDDDDSGNGKA